MASPKEEVKAPVPFIQSRLKQYHARVENFMDPKASVANSIALAATSGPAVSFPPVASAGVAAASPKGGSNMSPQQRQEGMIAAEINALRAEIAGVETVLGYMHGPKVPSARQSQDQAAKSRTDRFMRTLDDPGAVNKSLQFATMSVPTSPTANRSASQGGYLAGGAQKGAPGFNELTQDLRTTTSVRAASSWKFPTGNRPMGRGEAVILEAALDEALPAGAIAAKYQAATQLALSNTSAGGALALGTERGPAPSPALVFLESQDIHKDYELLEMVLQEASRQVSSTCTDRGRLLLKISERFRETFSTMASMVASLNGANSRLSGQLDAANATIDEQDAAIASLRASCADKDAEISALREQLASLSTQSEHQRWDAEQAIARLEGQNQVLVAEVEHYSDRLDAAAADKERALREGLADLEDELALLTDERDNLSQRIRFLERQMVKMRDELNRVVPTDDADVQTDPVEFYREEEEEPMEMPPLQMPEEPAPAPAAPKRRRKRGLRMLGGFEGLISSDRLGRVRGANWTTNCVAQIYFDKVVADSVADREGNPRMSICEFAYDWHLTKYGLKNLAEINLLDLIASVRHHGRNSQRIRWFAQFCGLVESGDPVDTIQHLSFYLFMIQQLAFPSSVTLLFPEGIDDPPVWIKNITMQEAVKAIFRYLNDPEAATSFMQRQVEKLMEPSEQTVPLDPMVRVLMQEFQRRVERNIAHLKALFRSGDLDHDGNINYDEFIMLMEHAAPEATDREITKMYSEAVRALPPGQYLIPENVFIAVARTYGLDRWKIDTSTPLPAPLPVGPHSVFDLVRNPNNRRGLDTSNAGAGSGPAMPQNSPGMLFRAQSRKGPPPVVQPGSATATAASTAVDNAINSVFGRSMSRGANANPRGGVTARTTGDGGALMRMLDEAVEALDPSLDQMMEMARERLRSSHGERPSEAGTGTLLASKGGSTGGVWGLHRTETQAMLPRLEGLSMHFQEAYRSRTDANVAWLAFRMLYGALASAIKPPTTMTVPTAGGGAAGGAGAGAGGHGGPASGAVAGQRRSPQVMAPAGGWHSGPATQEPGGQGYAAQSERPTAAPPRVAGGPGYGDTQSSRISGSGNVGSSSFTSGMRGSRNARGAPAPPAMDAATSAAAATIAATIASAAAAQQQQRNPRSSNSGFGGFAELPDAAAPNGYVAPGGMAAMPTPFGGVPWASPRGMPAPPPQRSSNPGTSLLTKDPVSMPQVPPIPAPVWEQVVSSQARTASDADVGDGGGRLSGRQQQQQQQMQQQQTQARTMQRSVSFAD